MTYKIFEAGETLSANDVMTYFMNQIVSQETTFADLAELPADVKVAYVTDDDSVYALLGSTWTKLAYNGENFTVDDLTVTGNLTVQGTTTTIDSTTIAVKDKFVFEGATADAHETTLQVAEPTADRTITLPDATGTVALTSGLYALPSQTGNSGKFLTTNGSADSWGTVDLTTKTDKSTLTTTGDIYYASAANTPARLGIGTTGQNLVVASGIPSWATPAASTPSFVGCSIYQGGAGQTPANATDTLLTFDSEFFDTNAFHSTVTNTGRVTIPTGYSGKYLINYNVRSVANTTGYRTLSIYKNGTSYVQLMDVDADGTVTAYPARSIILDLTAGDYLTFYYYQTSGGALTIYVREYEHPVQVQWLGA